MTADSPQRRPRGRPPGVVRVALAAWANEWAGQADPAALPASDLVQRVPGMSARAPGDVRAVRVTLRHMQRAGELVIVGTRRGPRGGRPEVLYLPAVQGAAPAVDLAAAMSAWR